MAVRFIGFMHEKPSEGSPSEGFEFANAYAIMITVLDFGGVWTMELFNGRPKDEEGRLPREIRTYDFLDELKIEYQRTDHDEKFLPTTGHAFQTVHLVGED